MGEEMRIRSASNQAYPFKWLDEVVEVTLNPDQTEVLQLTSPQLKTIELQFKTESRRILTELKSRTFFLFSSKKQRSLVFEYTHALRLLKQQAALNLSLYPQNSPLSITGEIVVIELNKLSDQLLKRYGRYLSKSEEKDEEGLPADISMFKVLCALSVDQLGLILKAADDTRLIVSRSISLVFRTIVPFLSTNKKRHISWNSMRSSTYHPEESDK